MRKRVQEVKEAKAWEDCGEFTPREKNRIALWVLMQSGREKEKVFAYSLMMLGYRANATKKRLTKAEYQRIREEGVRMDEIAAAEL